MVVKDRLPVVSLCWEVTGLCDVLRKLVSLPCVNRGILNPWIGFFFLPKHGSARGTLGCDGAGI